MATQSRLPAFLLTRPKAQSDRFAGMLQQRFGPDIDITISPLIAPEYLTPDVPDVPFDALIFTSETGVWAFMHHPALREIAAKRAYCVGNRTAKAALSAGLDPVSADGDAAALIDLILAQAPAGNLLHIHGEHTRGDVVGALQKAGLAATALSLYRQVPQNLSTKAARLLTGTKPIMAPLFSPRTATLFSNAVAQLDCTAPLICAALSDSVEQALMKVANMQLCKATKPNADALIEAMAEKIAATNLS